MRRTRYFINKYRIPLFTIANAFLLLILTLCFMNCKYTPAGGAEVDFFRKILGFKRAILSKNDLPDKFFFIDVGYSRKLIAKHNGNQDVADRYLLAKFFNVIHRLNNPQKFILCDIFFNDPSPDDTLLSEEMKRVKKLIIPYRSTEIDEFHSKFIPSDIHRGFVEYTAADTSGTFLKYPLIKRQNGQYYKSVPLRMYEEIHHATFEPGIFLSKIKNKFSLNALVVDFRVQENRPYHRLSELFTQEKNGQLAYPEQDLLKMIENRIVVIGDFSGRDMHETIMGNMPGPIILVNGYLALVYGDSFVSGYFLLFLFCCYFLISYNIFCRKDFTRRRSVEKTITGFNNMATWLLSKVDCLAKIVRTASKLKWEYFTYPFFLTTLFSFSLMLFFHIHLNILIFGSYLAILEAVVRMKRDRESMDTKAALLVLAEVANNRDITFDQFCINIKRKYSGSNITSEKIARLFEKYHIEM